MSQKIFTPIIKLAFLIICLSILVIQNPSYAEEEKFGGLGLMVTQMFDPDVENKMGSLVVLDALEGKPASRNGIQRGDVITHIDGELTRGKVFKYLILEKLRGKVGSKVDISIKRAGEKLPLNSTLTRIEITYSPEQEK